MAPGSSEWPEVGLGPLVTGQSGMWGDDRPRETFFVDALPWRPSIWVQMQVL